MAITRRSQFGLPLPPGPSSHATVRLVPLTTGVKPDTPWPLLPPGSAQSMTNFLPIDGGITPRSRLSSLNTINAPGLTIAGLAELTPADGSGSEVWISAGTVHSVLMSNGSISRASFVSSFGLGVSGLPSPNRWEYAQIYMGEIDDNVIVAAPATGLTSFSTLQVIYTNASGVVQYSYLTSAPQTCAIGEFDNYLVAFNTNEGGVSCPTRVRWCARGAPSNWTGEGSGFEDLLEMRGNGAAVKGGDDGRLYLFGDREIWYGLSAAYPAQFQFYPLDRTMGCPFPRTITRTPGGFVFVGYDTNLRVLAPGSASQVILPLAPILRRQGISLPDAAWAIYDQYTDLYRLHVSGGDSVYRSFVIRLGTGEIGFLSYPGLGLNAAPSAGLATSMANHTNAGSEGLFFASSGGTVFSTNSLKQFDLSSSVVTATWQSAQIASDLPGTYKQLLGIHLDYTATSRATVNARFSDGGYTYPSSGTVVASLASAPRGGRSSVDVYTGSAFPTIELTSTSTGFALQRLDVTLAIGGRP